MQDQTVIIISFIAAFPSTIAAILGFINSLAISRSESHSLQTKNAMELLEKNTNSMKDALIKVVGESEHAKGKLEGASDIMPVLSAAIVRQELNENTK